MSPYKLPSEGFSGGELICGPCEFERHYVKRIGVNQLLPNPDAHPHFDPQDVPVLYEKSRELVKGLENPVLHIDLNGQFPWEQTATLMAARQAGAEVVFDNQPERTRVFSMNCHRFSRQTEVYPSNGLLFVYEESIDIESLRHATLDISLLSGTDLDLANLELPHVNADVLSITTHPETEHILPSMVRSYVEGNQLQAVSAGIKGLSDSIGRKNDDRCIVVWAQPGQEVLLGAQLY